jgi:hypothetical protein
MNGTNPIVFVAIVLIWTLVCAGMGAYKCFFTKPEDIEETE